MLRITLILLLCTIYSSGFSQPVFFEKAFGSPYTDIARSVRQFSDGAIMVGGIRENGPLGGYDFALSRLSVSGQHLWTRFLGTAADDNCLYMNRCSDDNLILAGETYSDTSLLDGFIIKTDTAGNEIWRKMISTPLNESIRYIEETSDKGFVCAGYQNDVHGTNDSWFVRLDSLGEIVWIQTYGSDDNEYADKIIELHDGRFIATSDTKSAGNGGYDVELFLLDNAGNATFDLTFGDQFQNGCQGLIVLKDGNYLSYGETEIYTNSAYEMFLEKIDTAGNSVWRRTFGGNGTDAAFSVYENPDGTFILTGYTTSVGSGPLNVAVAKADSSGFLKWMKAYGSSGIDIGYDIQPSINGGFLIAGRTAPSDDQFYVLHVNEEGLLSSTNENKSDNKIVIYPNPASDLINIESVFNIDRLILYDMHGRQIKEVLPANSSACMNLDRVIPGIYTLLIQTQGKFIYRKLLVSQSY